MRKLIINNADNAQRKLLIEAVEQAYEAAYKDIVMSTHVLDNGVGDFEELVGTPSEKDEGRHISVSAYEMDLMFEKAITTFNDSAAKRLKGYKQLLDLVKTAKVEGAVQPAKRRTK